jgi:hypothetical protein
MLPITFSIRQRQKEKSIFSHFRYSPKVDDVDSLEILIKQDDVHQKSDTEVVKLSILQIITIFSASKLVVPSEQLFSNRNV